MTELALLLLLFAVVIVAAYFYLKRRQGQEAARPGATDSTTREADVRDDASRTHP